MKKIKEHLAVILGATLLMFSSCTTEKSGNRIVSNAQINQKGQDLMMNNCVTCHSPSVSQDNRLAPPMFAVKKHYVDEKTSLTDFTSDILTFLQDPKEEKTKMLVAVKKFGLMPKLGYTSEQITDVAEYIYQTDFQKPGWFDQHYAEDHGDSLLILNETDALEMGLKYTLATKAVLGRNLMGQITKNGTKQAFAFCNEKAIHLTDSMAAIQLVSIKRVSDKARNPNNIANKSEIRYIEELKSKINVGEDPRPIVFEEGNQSIGYYPIMTNQMCMQCHGFAETDITPSVQKRILDLYPEDKAIGYKVNELRGIWVVEMVKHN